MPVMRAQKIFIQAAEILHLSLEHLVGERPVVQNLENALPRRLIQPGVGHDALAEQAPAFAAAFAAYFRVMNAGKGAPEKPAELVSTLLREFVIVPEPSFRGCVCNYVYRFHVLLPNLFHKADQRIDRGPIVHIIRVIHGFIDTETDGRNLHSTLVCVFLHRQQRQ